MCAAHRRGNAPQAPNLSGKEDSRVPWPAAHCAGGLMHSTTAFLEP